MNKKQILKRLPKDEKSNSDRSTSESKHLMVENDFDQEFDAWIEAATRRSRFETGLADPEEYEREAQKLIESFESQYVQLDLMGQLNWFEKSLHGLPDSELLNYSLTEGIKRMVLEKLLTTRRKLGWDYESVFKDVERRKAIGRTDANATSELANGEGCPTCGKVEKYTDRNLEVVTLILNDLLEVSEIQPRSGFLTVEKYAEAIGFITGYSAQTTKQVINNPSAKQDTYPNAYDKDLEVRRKKFKQLGRNDLANKV